VLQRIVLWVDTTNRTAPQIMNGGASIPGGASNMPDHRDQLHEWFANAWRVPRRPTSQEMRGRER
jgi:hypothetical protein